MDSAVAVGRKYGNMPRAFARRRKAKRGPDKLDFADISLLLLRVHRQGFVGEEHKDIEWTKEEQIADRSCWCSKKNSARHKAIQMYLHPWFDAIIMWLIIANAIVLLFVDPLDKTSGAHASTRNQIINSFELFFNIVFTLEWLVKMIAISGKSYFRDNWNRLDFFVVFASWAPTIMDAVLEYIPNASASGFTFNLSAVRAIRTLKILRTANNIAGMKQIVGGIMNAVPNLLNVMYLAAFVFALFGIILVKLYGGLLRQRCFVPQSGANTTDNTSATIVWVPDLEGPVCTMGPPGFPDRYYCQQEGAICSYENPMPPHTLNPTGPNNHVGFDDFFIGSLTVFQIITLEGWVDIMYDVQDAEGIYHCFIFITLVLLGAFFVVNLVIGVIFENYNKAMEEFRAEEDRRKRESAAQMLVSQQEQMDAQTGPDHTAVEIGSCSSNQQTQLFRTDDNWFHAQEIGSPSSNRRTQLFRADDNWFHAVVCDNRFQVATMLLILLNTLILAIEHDDPRRLDDSTGMDPETQQTLDTLNAIFSVLFLLEMVFKHIGLGVKAYWTNPLDIFDGVIVIISIVDMILMFIGTSNGGGGVVSVFRAFRLLRVFKIVRKWKRLRDILNAMLKSAQGLVNFTILLAVVMAIYALVGMELFGGEYASHGLDPVPRSNFNSLFWSIITVFQVLTGENWNDVMHDHMEINAPFAVVFCVSLFCVGNYILMNIFLAILLENFDDNEYIAELEAQRLAEEEKKIAMMEAAELALINATGATPRKRAITNSADLIGLDVMHIATTQKELAQRLERQKAHEDMTTGQTLCCLDRENPVRHTMLNLVSSDRFNNTILFLIILSSIALAIDSPDLSAANPQLKEVLIIMDTAFTSIFVLEAIMKIVSRGFYWAPRAYLRDGWDRLDFLIVLISVINLVLSSVYGNSDLGALKTIRVLRALRPLRVAKRLDGVKRVIETILMSLPAIGNVMMIVFLFLLIFGILGVQLFKGGLYYCHGLPTDHYNVSRVDCHGIAQGEDGSNVTRVWVNRPENFDNILFAMSTLFGVTTLEMWPSTMAHCVDATQRGEHPVKNYAPAAALYFVLLIIICSIVISNLFIGIVVDSFNIVKARDTGTAHLSDNQMKWINTMKLMVRSRPQRQVKPLPGEMREHMGAIIQSRKFDLFIMACICLNVLGMTVNYWTPASQPQSLGFKTFMDWFNYTFLIIFILEAASKLFVFGFRQYFKDRWNRFDFLIIFIGLIVSVTFDENSPFDATILRIFRVARIFRLLKTAKNVQTLLTTLLYSLPAVSNVSALLFLFYYIFAIIGMNLFGDAPLTGEFYDRHANFKNVGAGMLLLFRCTTGESWNGISSDLTLFKGHGIPELYFIVFTVFGSMILVNVLIAVILDNFADIVNSDNVIVEESDLYSFGLEWGRLVLQMQHESVSGLRRVDSLQRLQRRLSRKGSVRIINRKDRVAQQNAFITKKISEMDSAFSGTRTRKVLMKSATTSEVSDTTPNTLITQPPYSPPVEKRLSRSDTTAAKLDKQTFQTFRMNMAVKSPTIKDQGEPHTRRRLRSSLAILSRLKEANIKRLGTAIQGPEETSKKFLSVHLFAQIFEHIAPPLGFKGIQMPNRRVLKARIRKHIRNLQIPLHYVSGHGKCVFFFEALVACVGIHFQGTEIEDLQYNHKIQLYLKQKLKTFMPDYIDLTEQVDPSAKKETLGEIEYGVYVIQCAVRKFIAHRRRLHHAARRITDAIRFFNRVQRFRRVVHATRIQRCFRASLVRRSRHKTEKIAELQAALRVTISGEAAVRLLTKERPRTSAQDTPTKLIKKWSATAIQRRYRKWKQSDTLSMRPLLDILKLERQRSEFMEMNILLSERELTAQQKLMEKQAAAHELALLEKQRLEAALVVQRFIRARKRNQPNAFRSMVSEVTKHLEFARAQALKAQAETEQAKELHAEEKTALQEQIAALQRHVERSEAEALLHAREKFRHEEDNAKLRHKIKLMEQSLAVSNAQSPVSQRSELVSKLSERLSVEIVGATESSFVVYQLSVSCVGYDTSWDVLKRYSDFTALNFALRSDGIQALPSLPPRTLFSVNLDERQKGLQTYISSVVARPDAWESRSLAEFLDNNENSLKRMLGYGEGFTSEDVSPT